MTVQPMRASARVSTPRRRETWCSAPPWWARSQNTWRCPPTASCRSRRASTSPPLKGAVVKGFEIRTLGEHAPGLAERDRAELLDLLASGRVAPHIDAVYPLGEVAGALRKVADRQSAGKVLVDPTR